MENRLFFISFLITYSFLYFRTLMASSFPNKGSISSQSCFGLNKEECEQKSRITNEHYFQFVYLPKGKNANTPISSDEVQNCCNR